MGSRSKDTTALTDLDAAFPLRFRRLGALFGSLPADLAEGANRWLPWGVLAGIALGLASLLLARGTVAGSVFLGLGAAILALAVLGVLCCGGLAAGHLLYRSACRRRCRALGLTVRLIVPESPALARRLHRRIGLDVPRRSECYALHVDPLFSMDRAIPPDRRRAAFARLYRADYDRILDLATGRNALVCSSTFSRYESPATEAARAEGWRLDAAGPLLPWQPLRHRPRQRQVEQRRMFGAVLSRRRMEVPAAWRVLVFDCLAAGHAGAAGEGRGTQVGPLR